MEKKDKTYFVAYNFGDRNLTCIGGVDHDFFTCGYKSIEYRNAVYFVDIRKTEYCSSVKLGKLNQTSDQKFIFNKRFDRQIPKLNNLDYVLFIKVDILYIYIFNDGILYSLDLKDEEAQLQKQPNNLNLGSYISNYMHCFNNSYIYFINGNSIHEIDCANITNITNVRSKVIFEGYEYFSDIVPRQTVILNGKIYFFDSKNFYQVDIETKAMKKFLLADLNPFGFEVKAFYITSKNKIRVYGNCYETSRKNFFMEITIDDGNEHDTMI